MGVRGGNFTNSWRGAALCAAAFAIAPAVGASLEAGPARVTHYEPFTMVAAAGSATGSTARKASDGGVRDLHFDAYGRRFDLTLERNSRLADAVATASPAAAGAAQSLYRGSLDNVPGSWVRMSAKGQTVRGMIWDGRDLYVVELADAVRDAAAAPIQAPAGSTVIFKLADTLIENGATFCGAADISGAGSQKGSDAYQSMLNELKGTPAIMRAAGASVRLELSALGDAAFHDRFASEQEARDEILLRLNNVDGIFSAQLGVEIQVPTLSIATDATDPFTATTVPGTLLNELGKLRKNTASLRARGLTHLFTGRNLDGNTVGIAYQDTLCRQEFGVGLTEASGRGAWIESLIAAHEIGHNFGAAHDGDPDDACAATPEGQFLMSPSVNQNASTFSDCSLAMMRPRMQAASCIVSLPPANLAIPADLGTVRQPLGMPFEWDLAVTNAGGSPALDSHVELLVPPVVTVDDAWVAGGTCTSGGGAITCQMGDIPGSTTRIVHLTLRSDVVGTNSISAHVGAQNDAQAADNDGSGTLVIDAAADLAAMLQSDSSVTTGSSVTANFSVTNLSAIAALTVNVEFTLSSGLAAASAQLAGGTCFVAAQTFRCTLPTLAAGATASGTVVINAVSAGAASVQASVQSSDVDPNAANDVAIKSITVTQPVSNPAQGGSAAGGGGGGSSGPLLLLGLLGLRFARRRS